MDKIFSKDKILITGASGLLGQAICKRLDWYSIPYIKTSHRIEDLSENTIFMDLESGQGVREAMQGKAIILHLASDKNHPENDVKGTDLMLHYIIQDGLSPHFIYISIVGTNQISLPYFKQKNEIEQMIIESSINFSILRATQFFEFIDNILGQLLKYPIGFIPKKMLIQPIDKEVVAEELISMIYKIPTNGITEIGGNEILSFAEMSKRWMIKYNKKRIIWNLPLWGKLGRKLLNGALITQNSDGNTSLLFSLEIEKFYYMM